MRKLCFSLLVICIVLLMVSFSFAYTPREGTPSEGKTTLTNLAVVGLENDGADALAQYGTPSYIEMTNTAGVVYYIYIGYDGELRMASEAAVGFLASPSTVGWSDASGVIVGDQTKD